MIRTNLDLSSPASSAYLSHFPLRGVPSIPIRSPRAHSMSHRIRTQFSITDWYGKQFPGDCLQYPDLEFYCDHLRAIPLHCPVKYNPSVHLSVQKFLASTFPSHSHSLVIEAASNCFSNDPPNEILVSLTKRAIPPQKFIRDVKSLFGQAVLDRRRSIKDPLRGGSFLPLWILTLWERLAELNAARREWSLAAAWFRRFSKTLGPTISSATEKHLARVGWSAEMRIGQERTTTLALPQLLADGCFKSTTLDLMAECTQVEVSYDGPASMYVCGTVFANMVARFGTREGPPEWFQKRFIDPVEKNQWKILYFPMFWPKHKHWVSVKINFTTKIASIG